MPVVTDSTTANSGETKCRSSVKRKSFVEQMALGFVDLQQFRCPRSPAAALRQAAINDGRYTIGTFGTFSVTKRKARKGRNPRTGEEIRIKASKEPAVQTGIESAQRGGLLATGRRFLVSIRWVGPGSACRGERAASALDGV